MNTLSILQNIANALGWTLVHFIWQGALIFFAYWIITKLFCKNRINLHYWVGMFFMILCLIVPTYEFISQLNTSTTSGVLHELRIQVSSLGDNGILSTKEMIISLIQMSIPYIVMFWGLSVLLIGSHLFKSWLTLIKLSKEKSNFIPQHLIKRFNSAIIQLKLKLKPLIVISEKIDIPATFGYLKPVVLIPAAMIAKLPQNQMEAILLHELCHIKRADFLHNIIQLLVETLFFYHPLTRWVSKDIRKVREQCCDKLVLDLGVRPMVYAKALTNIALLQNPINSPHLQIAANDGELLERIKFLMLKKQNKSPSTTIMAVLTITIAFMFVANKFKNTNPNSLTASSNNTESIASVKKPNYSIVDALNGLKPKKEKIKSQTETSQTSKPILVNNKDLNDLAVSKPTKPTTSPELTNNTKVINEFVSKPSLENKGIQTIIEDHPIQNTKPLNLAESNITNSQYPKLIRMVNPKYSKTARERGIEGTVILSFNIDKRGRVSKIKVDKSSPLKLLDGNARQALKKWRFAKSSINQNILNNRYQQIFSFYLNETGNCIDGDIGTRLGKDKICK